MGTIDLKSVKWRSRRGMLELDLIFQPFIEEKFDSLELQQSQLYWNLLEEEDQSLWRWFLGIESSPEQYQELIQLIKDSSNYKSVAT